MTYSLPTATEKETGLVVQFEVLPEYPSSEHLVRMYNEDFVGAHYISVYAFNELYEIGA